MFFLEQQAWSPVRLPRIYYATKEEAQKIRETFISNDRASEIPVLYLGLRDGRLFNDLDNKDLSAIPDILVGCESEKNKKFKFGHYDDMLQVIYRFLYVNAENLENDEFTNELGQIIEYVKEKKNAAFEEVKDSIKESVSNNELIHMTKYYKRNLADKNIKSDLVKSTFENTLVLNSSDVFIADKNAENYKMPPAFFERFLDEQYFMDYRSVNPPVWKATPEEAKIIRKVFIDNGKPEYVLNLYLRDNNKPRINNVLGNNVDKDKYTEMIELLKGLPEVNYNHKDEYGISIIEKIMNAENFELLDVVKNHNIDYLPELDDVYDNIQDKKFKEAIDNTKFNVEGLRRLLRKKSPELERHLSSALIQNNKVTLKRDNL